MTIMKLGHLTGALALVAGLLATGMPAHAKTQRQAEIAAVRAMAELEMFPPAINLDPKPADYAPKVWRYGLNGGAVQMRLKGGVKYPDDWGFAMNGGVSVTKRGRLWATWFLGEDGPEAFVAGARSDDGGKTWSAPKFVLDPHFADDRLLKVFPVMRGCVVAETWIDPDGALHLFASLGVGTPMVRGAVWDYVCRDPDAERIAFEKPVFVGYGWMHNKPLVLPDGTWVLATELEGGVSDDCFPELVAVRGVSSTWSTDKGRTWTRSNAVGLKATGHVIEPCVVRKKDGTLWMLARTGIGVHETFSHDGGKTWAPLRKAEWIQNPITRFAFMNLKSGAILLVKNGDGVASCDGVHARNKLKAYVSRDDGATWSKGYALDMRRWVDYPDAEQGPDGRIAITWGVDRRGLAEIRCAVLTEDEIARGKARPNDAFAGQRVFKATQAKESEAQARKASEFGIWEDTGKAATLKPGTLWYDTAGHVINAHGGGVMHHAGTYWWYGEHRVYGKSGNRAFVGVHAYSSKDLRTWDDRGIVLEVEDYPLWSYMSMPGEAPKSRLVEGCLVERPKVIYCAKTGKFAMYFHHELKGKGYSAALVGIAVADRPEGPFKYLRSLRPNGHMSRDMTLYVDRDGKAYHIYASEENKTAHVDELTDDYLDYTGKSTRILIGEETEGLSVARHGGKYYLLGSGCTGWAANPARLYVADKITGPYVRFAENPCRGTNPVNGMSGEKTWGGQSTFLLEVPGTDKVIAMFDIWNPPNHEESRYVWLPVDFTGPQPTITFER